MITKTDKTTFDNSCSVEWFIPKGVHLNDVIVKDEKELKRLNGSFEAIGNRMYEFIDAATRGENRIGLSDKSTPVRELIIEHFENQYGKDFWDNESQKKEFDETYKERISRLPNAQYDDSVSILWNSRSFRGQECPFNDGQVGNPDDISIYNRWSKKTLVINTLTAHLAKDHHLLEKGNRYGISADEFYRNFMPYDDYVVKGGEK